MIPPGRKFRNATSSSVRQVNRSIVLNLVRMHAPVSRAGISGYAGIFRSNVSEIVDELIAEGLVCEERAVPLGRGRVPHMLSLNDDGYRVAGASIRPDRTEVGFAGLRGEPRHQVSFATPKTPRSLVAKLAEALRKHRAPRLDGIGVAVPGLVNAASGALLWAPELPRFASFALGEELSQAVGLPVQVDNDNNLAALAELQAGGAADDFVLLEIGDFGVGAGMVVNGALYRGHDQGFAAEFGHMTVDRNGPACACGRRGCWELFVSNRATWARCTSAAFDAARFAGLVHLARNGDARVRKAFAETAEWLATGVSNIVYALNPAEIVIAGRVTEAWDIIGPVLEKAAAPPGAKSRVRTSRLGAGTAFLRGAVAAALAGVFARPELG